MESYKKKHPVISELDLPRSLETGDCTTCLPASIPRTASISSSTRLPCQSVAVTGDDTWDAPLRAVLLLLGFSPSTSALKHANQACMLPNSHMRALGGSCVLHFHESSRDCMHTCCCSSTARCPRHKMIGCSISHSSSF